MTNDSFSRQMYFPTMIFTIEYSDAENLNAYLLDLIYSERDKDQEGIQRSNFKGLGGWHSHNFLHKNETYKPLTDRIHQAGRRVSRDLGYHSDKYLRAGTMWSIVNPQGSSNKAHMHPNSHWSGVYYVHAPEGAGDIEFTDPRTAHIMDQPAFKSNQKRERENWTKVNVTPRVGRMLLFPSWLYHGVNPNVSNKTGRDADRVIISFNLSQVNL